MANDLLYQLTTQGGSQMMSYILRTGDGKTAVIDGGMKADAEYLLKMLREIQRTDGEVTVDLWLMTHCHCDHVDAFNRLMKEHRADFRLGAVYANFPSYEDMLANESADAYTRRDFDEVAPTFADVLHEFRDGGTLTCGDAVFEVLQVPDFVEKNNYINNSSVVFRLKTENTSVMFLGDLGVEGGERLLARYGGALKSDCVQMAHHGQNGVDRPVYEAIGAKVCFWDTPKWLWNNDAGNGWNTHTWKTIVVRSWMDELDVCEHHVIKDGTQIVSL